MEKEKEYSELIEISDFDNDKVLIFGRGRVFLPKIKEEYILDGFIPYCVVIFHRMNDYHSTNPIELHISLSDYKIIYNSSNINIEDIKKTELDDFKSWLFLYNKKLKSRNRYLLFDKWNEINSNLRIESDCFSSIERIYPFERNILDNLGLDKRYIDAFQLFEPIAEYELCKDVRIWMVVENNPSDNLKEPNIRIFNKDGSIELAVSLLSDEIKVINEKFNGYYKENILEYNKEKGHMLDIYNKWKFKLFPQTLSCSNLDNARKNWFNEHWDVIDINYPRSWYLIRNNIYK